MSKEEGQKSKMPLFNRGKDDEKCGRDHGANGAIYGLGFIGALVYYLSTASGFWVGVLGILKAMVWPAFVVYELMKFLHF